VRDVSLAAAALAGLLSFLSPCILPMVPFYLSYMAGASMTGLSGEAVVPGSVRGRAVLAAVLFSAGIITVFMALGATASVFGQFVREWMGVLRLLAASVIIVMGLHFLGIFRIGLLYRQFRAEGPTGSRMSLAGAYVIGMAFAFGWTPCVGPVLATILFTAAGADSASRGATLLFVYGLGMTLPFVLAALFVEPFLRWAAGFRKHLGTVEKVMGALLVLFGVLIGTNTVNYIAQWMLEVGPDLGVLR
jgi:cytochrome c-type biogenesis protein